MHFLLNHFAKLEVFISSMKFYGLIHFSHTTINFMPHSCSAVSLPLSHTLYFIRRISGRILKVLPLLVLTGSWQTRTLSIVWTKLLLNGCEVLVLNAWCYILHTRTHLASQERVECRAEPSWGALFASHSQPSNNQAFSGQLIYRERQWMLFILRWRREQEYSAESFVNAHSTYANTLSLLCCVSSASSFSIFLSRLEQHLVSTCGFPLGKISWICCKDFSSNTAWVLLN